MMIPACDDPPMPGAEDDEIFADILTTAEAGLARIRPALARFHAFASEFFLGHNAADQNLAIDRFRASGGSAVSILTSLIVRCYYRNSRVMAALGMEARSPFPLGFHVEPGDFSLLDPVRARGKIYRDVN